MTRSGCEDVRSVRSCAPRANRGFSLTRAPDSLTPPRQAGVASRPILARSGCFECESRHQEFMTRVVRQALLVPLLAAVALRQSTAQSPPVALPTPQPTL